MPENKLKQDHIAEYRYYHTRVKIGRPGLYCSGLLGSEHAPEFVQLLLAIPGVAWVRVSPYRLLVEKANLFTWDEIEPIILEFVNGLNKATQEPESAT